jgi:hypothetical protein
MIDSQLLGQTAARCMEYLDDHEALDGGELVAVGIVVLAQNSEGTVTYTRTFSSEDMYYRQIGLYQAGIECVRDGYRSGPPGTVEDDDEDE